MYLQIFVKEKKRLSLSLWNHISFRKDAPNNAQAHKKIPQN